MPCVNLYQQGCGSFPVTALSFYCYFGLLRSRVTLLLLTKHMLWHIHEETTINHITIMTLVTKEQILWSSNSISLGLEWLSVKSFPMNLIQNHNKSCDEHIVNMWEHGNNKGVLSQQYVGGCVIVVYLQHQIKLNIYRASKTLIN